MHPLFRASFAFLVFSIFAAGTWAAPVPHSTSLSVASAPPSAIPFNAQYSDTSDGPYSAVAIDGTHTSNALGNLASTGSKTHMSGMPSAKQELVTLYRRNGFTDFFHHLFHKIGEGFHKMAEGIKHVAQKIGEGFHKMADGIKHVAQKIGSGIVHVAKKIASGVKHVAEKIASGVKHVAQKIATGVKHVAQKIASGVKTAVHAVGHFMQTTGAKIAKVGLKIFSTVQKAVSKVVGWIPVIGKPIARVMDAESEGLNKASDKINVHIGGALGKAMDNMSKAQHYMGFIPRELVEDIVMDHAVRQLTEREFLTLNMALAARADGFINGAVTGR